MSGDPLTEFKWEIPPTPFCKQVHIASTPLWSINHHQIQFFFNCVLFLYRDRFSNGFGSSSGSRSSGSRSRTALNGLFIFNNYILWKTFLCISGSLTHRCDAIDSSPWNIWYSYSGSGSRILRNYLFAERYIDLSLYNKLLMILVFFFKHKCHVIRLSSGYISSGSWSRTACMTIYNWCNWFKFTKIINEVYYSWTQYTDVM